MSDDTDDTRKPSPLLPDFMRRSEYMKVVHGKSDYTGQRWQEKGLLVVEYFGRTPYVNIPGTNARRRGDDRPRRRKP